MIREGLYLFDYPRGSVAFQFRNKEEGEIIRMKIKSNCPSLEEYEEIRKKNEAATKKK